MKKIFLVLLIFLSANLFGQSIGGKEGLYGYLTLFIGTKIQGESYLKDDGEKIAIAYDVSGKSSDSFVVEAKYRKATQPEIDKLNKDFLVLKENNSSYQKILDNINNYTVYTCNITRGNIPYNEENPYGNYFLKSKDEEVTRSIFVSEPLRLFIYFISPADLMRRTNNKEVTKKNVEAMSSNFDHFLKEFNRSFN
jgi:hypothetical protein